MMDTIVTIGRSTVQHGPLNNRVYLMHLCRDDIPRIIIELDDLAATYKYTKILARVPESMEGAFRAGDYIKEAVIPRYMRSGEDLLFMSKFLSKSRRKENHPTQMARHLKRITTDRKDTPSGLGDPSNICSCGPEDCIEMARIFEKVFASYPFPLHNPDYLAQTMNSHTHYYGVTLGGRIVALCAGEVDRVHRAAEMTDFAVLPKMRGRGLAASLLKRLEKEMYAKGLRTAFTISRTLSLGMNMVFKRANYTLGGTLINNTQISGGIESMWVWHKRLTG